MAEPFATHLRLRYFDAAFVADDAAVFHPLVLSAEAFPIRNGAKNTGAKQAVALRFERPVIDRFRLRNLAVRP